MYRRRSVFKVVVTVEGRWDATKWAVLIAVCALAMTMPADGLPEVFEPQKIVGWANQLACQIRAQILAHHGSLCVCVWGEVLHFYRTGKEHLGMHDPRWSGPHLTHLTESSSYM